MPYTASRGSGEARSQFRRTSTYMMYVQEPGDLEISGTVFADDKDFTLGLHKGWNHLPYLCNTIQDVNVALSDYFTHAQPGDQVKSYSEFAEFSADRHWVGSLTHMRPGEGYFLRRTGSETVDFRYFLHHTGNETDNELSADNYQLSPISATAFSVPTPPTWPFWPPSACPRVSRPRAMTCCKHGRAESWWAKPVPTMPAATSS